MSKSDYIKQKLEKYSKLTDGKIREPRVGTGIGVGVSANKPRKENASLEKPNQKALQKGVAKKKWPFDPAKDESVENRRVVESWTAGYGNDPRKERSDIKEMPHAAKHRGLHKLTGMTKVRRNKDTGEREFLLHRGMGVIEHYGISVNKHSDDMSSWTPDWLKADAFAQDEVAHDVNNEDTGHFTDEIGHEPEIGKHLIHSAWIPESQIHHIPNTIGSVLKLNNLDAAVPEDFENKDIGSPVRRNEQEILVKPHKLNLVDYGIPENDSKDINKRINARATKKTKATESPSLAESYIAKKLKKYHNLTKKSEPLHKASKKQMKQSLGDGHDEVINWLSRSVKRDDVQNWFIRNYKKDPSIFNQKNRSDIQHFMSMTSSVKELDSLRLDKTHDFESGIQALKIAEESGKSRLLDTSYIPASGKKVMDAGDGHQWVDLQQSGCEVEGNAMGHCGNTAEPHPNDTILSLRKETKIGETRLHEPKATFILNDGKLGEMKGKANKKPIPKYHEAIVKLLTEHPGITHIIGGGHDSHNNFSLDDLTDEQRQRVLAAKPDIDPLFNSLHTLPNYEEVENEEYDGEEYEGEGYFVHSNSDLIDAHNQYVKVMNKYDGNIDHIIENGQQHEKDKIGNHRDLTPEQMHKLIDYSKKYRIPNSMSGIAGHPNATPDVLERFLDGSIQNMNTSNGVASNKNATPDQINRLAKTGNSMAVYRVTDKDILDDLSRGGLGEHRTHAASALYSNPLLTSQNISDILDSYPNLSSHTAMNHKNFTEDHMHHIIKTRDFDRWKFSSEYHGVLEHKFTPRHVKEEALSDRRSSPRVIESAIKGLGSDVHEDDLQAVVNNLVTPGSQIYAEGPLKALVSQPKLSANQIHSIVSAAGDATNENIDRRVLFRSDIISHANTSPETLAHVVNNPDIYKGNYNGLAYTHAALHPNLPENRIGTALSNLSWDDLRHSVNDFSDKVKPEHFDQAIQINTERGLDGKVRSLQNIKDRRFPDPKPKLEKAIGDLKFPQLPKLTRPQEEVADITPNPGAKQDRQLRMQSKIGDNRLRQQIASMPEAKLHGIESPSDIASHEELLSQELGQVKPHGGGKVVQNPASGEHVVSIATHAQVKPHEGIHHTVAKLAEHMNSKSDDYDWTPHIYDKMNSFIHHEDKKILHDAIAGVEVGGEGYENHEIPHEYVPYMHDLLTSKLHRDHYLGEDHDPRKLSRMKQSYQKIRNWAKNFDSGDFHKEVAGMYDDTPLAKADKIPGGLADDKDPSDFDDSALKEGVKVELEHTTDLIIALEIAMDHLTEDPEYYKKLATIEGKDLKKSDGECPQVAAVVVIKGDTILMGKRRDNGKWTLPGGHLDAGESPIDGASRELYEESGIKTKDLNHLASEKVDCEDGKARTIHAFVTFGMYKTRKDLDPDGEISVWKWVPIEDGYLPEEIASNLHSPKNVTLNAIGIKNLKFD